MHLCILFALTSFRPIHRPIPMNLSRWDTFARPAAHVTTRSSAGGVLSLACALATAVLLASEFRAWRAARLEEHLMVDASPGERRFELTLEVDLPGTRCDAVTLGAEDSKGQPLEDARIAVARHAIDAEGRIALGAGLHPDSAPGCKLKGVVGLHRVAGSFHIAGGRALGGGGAFGFLLAAADFAPFNASHIVRSLVFGPAFPGQLRPLDGLKAPTVTPGTQFQYHMKVRRGPGLLSFLAAPALAACPHHTRPPPIPLHHRSCRQSTST